MYCMQAFHLRKKVKIILFSPCKQAALLDFAEILYIHTYIIHRVYLPTVPFQMAKPSDLPRGRAIKKIMFLNMIF